MRVMPPLAGWAAPAAVPETPPATAPATGAAAPLSEPPWEPMLAPGTAPWVGVFAVAVALLLVVFAGRALWATLPMRRATRERVRRAGPLLLSALALAYALWAVGVILSPHPQIAALTQGGLLVASLAAAWPMLRDVVAGLVLRGSASCTVGDVIRVGEVEGRVVTMGLRTLQVQTPGGAQALVPYRAVTQDVVVRTPTDEASAHQFRVGLPPGSSPAEAATAVERAVTESHWAALSRPPRVTLSGAESLEVTVFALSPAHALEVERAVRDALSGQARP